MTRPRFLAAVSSLVAVLAVAAVSLGGEPAEVVAAKPTSTTIASTTTTQVEFPVHVASGIASIPLSEEEIQLTEAAIGAPDATTTTAVPVETTTSTAEESNTDSEAAAAPPATSPPATSPPTTTPPTTTPPTTAPSGEYSASAENDFAGRINSHRSSNGLGSLSRSGSLDSYARSWAREIAERRSLDHSNIGSLLGPWGAVAENLGAGGSVGAIFNALVASSGHNSNMLGDYTHMGIGVWRDAGGELWTVHVFAR